MNEFSVFALILLPLLIVVLVYSYTNRKQVQQVLDGRKSLDDGHLWLRYAVPTEALVVSREETLDPLAHGIAKADLELEIRPAHGAPFRASTCWLVEAASLPDLEAGRSVMVKYDPKKPGRIFPAVPWARAWVFGK